MIGNISLRCYAHLCHLHGFSLCTYDVLGVVIWSFFNFRGMGYMHCLQFCFSFNPPSSVFGAQTLNKQGKSKNRDTDPPVPHVFHWLVEGIVSLPHAPKEAAKLQGAVLLDLICVENSLSAHHVLASCCEDLQEL